MSYLPPISTVTDDEACEPLRLVVASPSSLPAAARLLQQLEHNQVGLLTAATHIVAISAPRGSCLHLCVGRYSSENLNQTTCRAKRVHTTPMIDHQLVDYGRHLDTGPPLRGHVCWLLCRWFYSSSSHSLRGISLHRPASPMIWERASLCVYAYVCVSASLVSRLYRTNQLQYRMVTS